MRKCIFLFFILSNIYLVSCSSSNDNDKNSDQYVPSESNYDNEAASSSNSTDNLDQADEENNDDNIEDGDHAAVVEYYNPETGTNSSYNLNVYVEDGELQRIDWPNGGWLDESHFSPSDISSGSTSFVSDNGVRFTVTIDD